MLPTRRLARPDCSLLVSADCLPAAFVYLSGHGPDSGLDSDQIRFSSVPRYFRIEYEPCWHRPVVLDLSLLLLRSAFVTMSCAAVYSCVFRWPGCVGDITRANSIRNGSSVYN